MPGLVRVCRGRVDPAPLLLRGPCSSKPTPLDHRTAGTAVAHAAGVPRLREPCSPYTVCRAADTTRPGAQQSPMASSTLWLILIILGADLVVVPLLVWAMVNALWAPLAQRYPARPIAPDAVRRDFQSYKIGLLNLGGMLHTAVDDAHLHLLPAAFGRLCRMRPVSVPWEAIEPVRRRGKRHAEVKFGKETVVGPSWALGLAFGEAPADDL